MGFTIGYSRLCTIQILHGYFLNQGNKSFDSLPEDTQIPTEKSYNVGDFLTIVPSSDTQALMKNRGMIFRMNEKGFFVGIKLDQVAKASGLSKAFFPLDDEVRLRFFLKIKDPYFLNYSNLPLKNPTNKIYHFSNSASNSFDGLAHLSKPVPVYDSSEAYEAGNLIVDDSNNPSQLFEALRNTGNGPFNPSDWEEQLIGDEYTDPPTAYSRGDIVRQGNSLFEALIDPNLAPPDASQWEESPISHQYAGEEDTVSLVPELFSVSLPDGTGSARAKVYQEGLTDPVLISDVKQGGVIKDLSIDLQSLEPGIYTLDIEDTSGTVLNSSISGKIYVDQELYEFGGLGLIEIFHKPGMDMGEYQLVDLADQQLLSPEYSLRFKNRSTFWRYIFKQAQTVSDAQLGEFERDGGASENKSFKTQSPKPLTKTLEFLKKFNTDILLPNPTVNLVKPDATDGQIYSEIYINS